MASPEPTPIRERPRRLTFRARVRCWVCMDSGRVRHRCPTGLSCKGTSAPCPNPHCAAGAEQRGKGA